MRAVKYNNQSEDDSLIRPLKFVIEIQAASRALACSQEVERDRVRWAPHRRALVTTAGPTQVRHRCCLQAAAGA